MPNSHASVYERKVDNQSRLAHMNFIARIAFAGCLLLAPSLPAGDPPVKAPKAATQQAEAYITSLPAAQKPKDRARAIDDFLGSFFTGFIDTRITISGGSEENRQGFKAGQAYRRANPGKIKETMEGFSYVATEAEGLWTVGIERSRFRPRNRPGDEWWLWPMEGMESDLPKGEPTRNGPGVTVRVIGFLSPVKSNDLFGGYGHLNQYDHEIYVMKISKLNGN